MPVSVNALFNIPTREEKSRKQLLDQQQEFAAGQSALDQSRAKERMSIADEMARGQMEFSKKLGLEFGQKEYEQVRQNAMRELGAAGETPTMANEKLGKARSSPIYDAANNAVKSITGGLLGLPEQQAATERAEAKSRESDAVTRGLLAEGRKGIASDLGEAQGSADFADAILRQQTAGAGYRTGPAQEAAVTAELAQRKQAAEEYSKAEDLRGLLNAVKLQEAIGRQRYLADIDEDPLYRTMTYGGIPGRDFGGGVVTPFGVNPLPLPGGQQVKGMLGNQGMAEKPDPVAAVIEAFKERVKAGGGVKLAPQ